jgi:hypothetical protein
MASSSLSGTVSDKCFYDTYKATKLVDRETTSKRLRLNIVYLTQGGLKVLYHILEHKVKFKLLARKEFAFHSQNLKFAHSLDCPACNYTSNNVEAMTEHWNDSHFEIELFYCDVCDQQFHNFDLCPLCYVMKQ